MTSFQKRVQEILTNFAPLEEGIKSLPAVLDALKHPDAIDDRKLLLEQLLTLMSELGDTNAPPEYQRISLELQDLSVDFLYKDLPHPPSGYLALPPTSSQPSAQAPTSYTPGTYVNYAYRSADGSNYNPLIPSMGQAGTPYARSVPSGVQTNLKNLPDPGLVFDTLLKRPTEGTGKKDVEADGFTPHPGGVSSLFFAFADIIIHSIFNTNQKNPTVNNASSYLDLSVVYGSSEAQVQSVRRKDDKGRPDGTGRLYEDVFADSRLLLMPPATCALLVLFSRNHNFIAQKILDINEWSTYKDPSQYKAQIEAGFAPSASSEQKKAAAAAEISLRAQDDEIFHRSRLVNCGFFMKVILGDYVGAILGLVRDGRDWRLDTLVETRRTSHEWVPRGDGNVVSLEFNLLYRWHAALSRQDAKWTENMFKETLEKEGVDTTFDKLTPAQFFRAAGKALQQTGDVRTWTFNGLKRDGNGRFSDADIANILQDSTSYRAGAFRARGIPEALRVIEILGIEQARGWGACSLNEFRKFIGLKPYKTFEQWNSDPSVAQAAKTLYKNIDNLELHVGMQAEEAKVPGPGAGLCPGYTISRAILADAVCLSRGDRFLTVDFTPFNFTTWGFADCQYPTSPDGSFGGMLTKLLFRHFPAYYPARSAYAHFPFLEPSYMENILHKKGTADQYIWTRPSAPLGIRTGESSVVGDYMGASAILATPQVWDSNSQKRLGTIVSVSGLQRPKVPDLSIVSNMLLASSKDWPAFFVQTTQNLIKSRSISHVSSSPTLKYVDIVNDVINVLPVRWICEKLAGLSIGGEYPEARYIQKLDDVCRYVFLDWYPVDDWHLRESSVEFFRYFSEAVKHHLESESGFISNTVSHFKPRPPKTAFLETLHHQRHGKSADELAAALFCLVIPTAAHWAQSVAHVINHYLCPIRDRERTEVVTLVREGKKDQAMALIRTALVADPPVSGVQRTAVKDTVVPGSTKQFVTDETVFVSIIEANKNRLGEPGILGVQEHGLLASEFFETITPGVVGEILGLKNLQRGSGESGNFTRFTEDLQGAPVQVYINENGGLTPFPASLTVSFT